MVHTMSTYAPITNDIGFATDIIQQGRVVAVPTGTSYGLAADALQGHALQRVRNLKGREQKNPFSVFIAAEYINVYFKLSVKERELFDSYKTQALTLLLTPKEPARHLAHEGLVAVRMIDHPLMQELATSAQVPLTATSANISGQDPCFDTVCIQKSFPGLLEPTDTRHGDITRAGTTTYDLSLGAIIGDQVLPKRKPTTLAKVVGDEVVVLRQGEVSFSRAAN